MKTRLRWSRFPVPTFTSTAAPPSPRRAAPPGGGGAAPPPTAARGVGGGGDAAEYNGQLYGTWAASQEQGTVAGINAAGGASRFGGLPRANTVKAVGLDLISIGRFQPEDGGDLLVEENLPDRYMAFVFRDNRMVGTLLVGHADLAVPAKRAIEDGADFSLLLAAPACDGIAARLRGRI